MLLLFIAAVCLGFMVYDLQMKNKRLQEEIDELKIKITILKGGTQPSSQ